MCLSLCFLYFTNVGACLGHDKGDWESSSFYWQVFLCVKGVSGGYPGKCWCVDVIVSPSCLLGI